MISIKCPRLGIESCSPAEFAAKLNAITTFPETDRSNDDERKDLAILSCMVALGGSAKCRMLPQTGMLQMSSNVGDLVIGFKDGQVTILEAFEENGQVKLRAMKFEIVEFWQRTDESSIDFFERITTVAATYAASGAKIISLSFPEAVIGRLFIQEN
jgi:hypothetical protein